MMKFKNAFSMLELIFVIVILGIVASVGSSIIVKVYESYIIQRAVHNASLKTELAITQLANRLVYRIDTSVVARVPGSTGNATPADIVPLRNILPSQANTHRTLEWIAYDNDGFSTQGSRVTGVTPAWSGFTDLLHANTDGTNIVSTGSTLGTETIILANLFPNMVNPAIVFMAENYQDTPVVPIPYDAMCMYGGGAGCIFPVTLAGNILTFTGVGNRTPGNMVYSEFYQLAGSAYAVVPVQTPANGEDIPNLGVTVNGTPVWDLTLHYDYQPWEGENHLTNVNNRSILLKKVSVFRFKQEENSVRIKICTTESIGTQDVSICKEKAIIR